MTASCGDDTTTEDPSDSGITISFEPDAIELKAGTTGSMSYSIVSLENITKLTIIRDGEGTILTVSDFPNKTSYAGSLSLNAAAADAGKKINYTFEVTNKDGAVAKKQFVLTVTEAGGGGTDPIAINFYSALMMGV